MRKPRMLGEMEKLGYVAGPYPDGIKDSQVIFVIWAEDEGGIRIRGPILGTSPEIVQEIGLAIVKLGKEMLQ